MNDKTNYAPSAAWSKEQESGGKFASINRVRGEPEEQLHERHQGGDFQSVNAKISAA